MCRFLFKLVAQIHIFVKLRKYDIVTTVIRKSRHWAPLQKARAFLTSLKINKIREQWDNVVIMRYIKLVKTSELPERHSKFKILNFIWKLCLISRYFFILQLGFSPKEMYAQFTVSFIWSFSKIPAFVFAQNYSEAENSTLLYQSYQCNKGEQ